MQVAKPESSESLPATVGQEQIEQITRAISGPTPAPAGVEGEPDESPADVLKALGDKAETREREDPQKHVITEADMGRTLGDLAYEIATGALPPMTDDQQRMLREVLFEKGWTQKSIELPLGYTVTLRTSSTKLATAVKRRLRVEVDQVEAEAKAKKAMTNQEFMLLTNRIIVASQLAMLGDQATCDEEKDFDSPEALGERVDFVLEGAYDGQGVSAVLLDRLAIELNAFNDEIQNLLSGKYLSSF